MPYLDKAVRASLDDGRKSLAAGELNYIISTEIDQYLTRKGLNYTTINEVMGVLACVQSELYRRVASPYEDKKCRENGEVFLNV